ncbi:hypothetical protein HD554DRAFT_2141901 [Boletus coccyginus]|nr:hypothetical protein HD554DRAFT_2141901 [Boletus coccyginus]
MYRPRHWRCDHSLEPARQRLAVPILSLDVKWPAWGPTHSQCACRQHRGHDVLSHWWILQTHPPRTTKARTTDLDLEVGMLPLQALNTAGRTSSPLCEETMNLQVGDIPTVPFREWSGPLEKRVEGMCPEDMAKVPAIKLFTYLRIVVQGYPLRKRAA